MIRPLRQMHRLALPVLLAVLLPVVTLVLHGRPADARAGSAPATASIRLLQGGGSHRQIEVRLPADLPEVLAYWVPDGEASVDAKAVLIGRPIGPNSVLDLPDSLHVGQLLLYSLPQKQVIVRQSLADGVSP